MTASSKKKKEKKADFQVCPSSYNFFMSTSLSLCSLSSLSFSPSLPSLLSIQYSFPPLMRVESEVEGWQEKITFSLPHRHKFQITRFVTYDQFHFFLVDQFNIIPLFSDRLNSLLYNLSSTSHPCSHQCSFTKHQHRRK